jgi:hypothetical protein
MDFEFGNQYLIYIAILLCLNIILFYLFYKLYLKTNDHSDKLEKIDKLLAEIFINTEQTRKESTKTKKQAKVASDEKKEMPDMGMGVGMNMGMNMNTENTNINTETLDD